MIRKKNKKAYKMLERLLQDDYVKIGVLNNPDPGTPPGSSKQSKATDQVPDSDQSLKVIDIAMIHEFGTSKIPQRSFIRGGYHQIKKMVPEVFLKIAKRELRKNHSNPEKMKQKILMGVGVWASGKIRERFSKIPLTPWSKTNGSMDSWPKLKSPRQSKSYESSPGFVGPRREQRPLIDTGQLRASVNFEVITNKGRKFL